MAVSRLFEVDEDEAVEGSGRPHERDLKKLVWDPPGEAPFNAGDVVASNQEVVISIMALHPKRATTKGFKELTVKSVWRWERIPTWIVTFKEVRGSYAFHYFQKA